MWVRVILGVLILRLQVDDFNHALANCGWDRDESNTASTRYSVNVKATTLSQGTVIRNVLYTVVEETSVTVAVQYGTKVQASTTLNIYGPQNTVADIYA